MHRLLGDGVAAPIKGSVWLPLTGAPNLEKGPGSGPPVRGVSVFKTGPRICLADKAADKSIGTGKKERTKVSGQLKNIADRPKHLERKMGKAADPDDGSHAKHVHL